MLFKSHHLGYDDCIAGPRLTGSSSSLNKSSDNRGRSASIQLGDSDSYHGSDVDLSNRTKFDQVFDKVLSELEPVCLAEQDFCVKFFHLTSGEVMDVTDILVRSVWFFGMEVIWQDF